MRSLIPCIAAWWSLAALAAEPTGNPFLFPWDVREPQGQYEGSPLINLLPEDTVIWETVDSAREYRTEPMAAAPYPATGTVPFLGYLPHLAWLTNGVNRPVYVQPLQKLRSTIFVASDPLTLYGKGGLSVEKGANALIEEAGSLAVHDRFGAYWSFRHRWGEGDQTNEIHRAYATLRFGKFTVEGGRDSINFGPGEWGLLLSSNAAPFWLLKFQNNAPMDFFGKWSFLLLNGWLFDRRTDHSNPQLFAARVVYQPVGWIEIGVTRTELYGGSGRPTYKVHEFPEVVFGGKDNIPYSRFDNDGYAAIDLSFSLPMERWTGGKVRSLRIYFQEAGTDIAAPWQPEDRIFTFPWLFFHLFERAYLMGMTLALPDHFFRIEYAKTAYSFYRHHQYPSDGYTYRGLSLGYPFGRNIQSIFFKHRWFAAPRLTLEYRLGLYQGPAHGSPDHKNEFALAPLFTLHGGMTRYWGEATLTVPFGNWFFECYGRIEGGSAHDADPSPLRFDIVHRAQVEGGGGVAMGMRF